MCGIPAYPIKFHPDALQKRKKPWVLLRARNKWTPRLSRDLIK